MIQTKIHFPETEVKVVSSGIQQQYSEIAEDLKKLDVNPTTIEQIYSGVPYIPMQTGVTYGFLRFQPKAGDALKPTDIPVFDELPLDLSVVAGVITTVIQDAGSHINLKSKERNTPDVVVRDPERVQNLKSLDGQPVKLTVVVESFDVKPVLKAEVDKFWNAKRSMKKWTLIKSGPLQNPMAFDELAKQMTPLELVKTSSSYGGKASKLAFLAHPVIAGIGSSLQKSLQYRLTTVGFAIPVSWYQKFVKSDKKLEANIQKLVASLSGKKTVKILAENEKQKLIQEIQTGFLNAKFPSEFVQPLKDQIAQMQVTNHEIFPESPVKKIKVRSSANAEDIEDFDGAGLHSSYSAKIDNLGTESEPCKYSSAADVATKEEIEPDTIICAIKGVYSSLWNRRAIDERDFAKIDQSTAAMGIAINNSYDFRKKSEKIVEIANGVVVTRIINSKGVYGYRASFNIAGNLVTNPTPGTQAEVLLSTFVTTTEEPQFSFLQFARTEKAQEVMTRPLLDEKYYRAIIRIAQNIEFNYCQAIPTYYSNDCHYVAADVDKPKSLDMEFKIYSNGQVLLKQVREFSGE